MPRTVPNSSADTATFASSDMTGVSLSANTEVNSIVFNAGASAFTVTASPTFTLTISGLGNTNNSGITQNFVTTVDGASNPGFMAFTNSATAGSLTSFTNNGGTVAFGSGGLTSFFNSSTADHGAFTDSGGTVIEAFGGGTNFRDSSTAGNGSFTINGGAVSNAFGGVTAFLDSSTAGNGTFTVNGGAVFGGEGGYAVFFGNSTAGNATFTINGGRAVGAGGGVLQVGPDAPTTGNAILIATSGSFGGDGASIQFFGDSTGGTARVEVFGDGTLGFTNAELQIDGHNAPGVTIGSIEGNGIVSLGNNNLTVGGNDLSTAFAGIITDGGGGGSLTKTGRGKLTLSNANTYNEGTTVNNGTLLVTNKTGSATGMGAVQVSAGTLGGTGEIAGSVTISSATSAAFLAPGSGKKTGTLTIRSALTFNSPAIYKIDLNSGTVTADRVSARRVTINSGASVLITDLRTAMLPTGTVLTVISNAAATRIAGTFSNLADGSTFTVGSNTYQVSYEGGDGNDLTLTVQ